MRCILLNPGPVSLSDAVRRAAVSTDLGHHEPEFRELHARVRAALIDAYGLDGDEWVAVLLGGPGISALEASLASLLPRDGRLLVVANGSGGERISQIADIHGIAATVLSHDWMDAVDYGRVEEALAAGGYSHVAAVHHETATGRLNDAARLADICEHHGVQLLLDAAASFGAEDIPFASPALAACTATADACLHGLPGLCFVIARRPALASAVTPPRSLGLHLPGWLEFPGQPESPLVPPANGLLALDAALAEFDRHGGWQGRRAWYAELAWQVSEALTGFGVEPLLPAGDSSCVLNAYRVPSGFSYSDVHDGLKRWGFVIDPGPGRLGIASFRISTLGDVTRYDIGRLMAAIETVFKR
jgi:2-aminoethylphosphonate-pyruvate transaminase